MTNANDAIQPSSSILRIAIVAGELSGDLLGANLIRALRVHFPYASFEGIGGPNMLAAGFKTHYPLEMLSVMGLVEVLKHYRELKQCRDDLCDYFLENPPDVFIGIDAPDFNLGLEAFLKQANIPTVHYVSPSVWAWRQYRLKKIARACDLMLTLFPFEARYYQENHIPVQFVGHPLADEIALDIADKHTAKQQLGLDKEKQYIAILPGSRQTELKKLSPIFLKTAYRLHQAYPDLHFIVPLAHDKLKYIFEQYLKEIAPDLPITLIDGQSRQVMAASEVILMASGTATLEGMLLKRPMVVAYRLAELTYWIAKPLVKIPFFALPNLLARDKIVPEFIQHQATPQNLGRAIINWLDDTESVKQLEQRFTYLHKQLRQSASQQAAQAIADLIT